LAGALIVLAAFGEGDLASLDALRRKHYPPERNRVPAHLTLFRTLPPSAEAEVMRRLARAVSGPRPRAELAAPMDFDGGVALRVRSPELEAVRAELADEFHGLLTAQDLGLWTPHVTIQNKVEPREARKLLRQLKATFEPRPIAIGGIQLVRYSPGEWERLADFRFR
jgi:hypothetical protein